MLDEVLSSCQGNCEDCAAAFKMPFGVCCLFECNEHEFCKGCIGGVNSEDFNNAMSAVSAGERKVARLIALQSEVSA